MLRRRWVNLGFLIALLAGAAGALRSQGPGRLPLKVFGVQQGMASEVITGLAQDASGLIWAGTESGLHYYDGQTFTPFPAELPSQLIQDLYADPGGRLWVATQAGLGWVEGGRSGSIPPAQGIPAGRVANLGRDGGGRLWVLCVDGLRVEAAPGSFVEPPAPVAKGRASLLFAHPKVAGAWVVDDGRLWRWEQAPGQPGTWIPESLPPLDPQDAMIGLALDETGQVWLRTSRKVWRRPAGAAWKVDRIQTEGGFSAHDRMERDAAGWVWFYDKEGLWRAKGEVQERLTPARIEGRGALVDRDGGVWLRTHTGVVRLLGGMAWRWYGPPEGLPSPTIWQPLRDTKGRLWVGTESGLCVFEGGRWRKVLSNRILSLAEGPHHELWASGSPGGMAFRVDLDTLQVQSLRVDVLPLARIATGIAVDGDGNPWISDAREGLARGRKGPAGWTWTRERIGDAEARLVNSLACGPGGAVAVAFEGGAAVYQGGTWTFVEGVEKAGPSLVAFSPAGQLAVGYGNRPVITTHVPYVKGFRRNTLVDLHPRYPQATLLSLAFQDEGHLWVGTSMGLVRIHPSSNEGPRLFALADGLISTDCDEGALMTEADSVWVGTSKGLSEFRSGRLEDMPPLRAPVILSARSGAFGLPLEETWVVLPNGPRELNLHFLVPTYRYPGRLRFQYREDGPSEEWVDLEEPKLHYPGLSSGPHTILLRGVLEDGAAGPATVFRFEVPPRWWETLSARAAFVVLLGLLVYGLIRFRQAQLMARNRALQEEVARQTMALQLASDSKSAFLANMSHELRTPLNAILLYTELLQESAREDGLEPILQDAEKIQGAGRQLLAIINDILDMSKIEAGLMELHLEEVELRPLVRDLAATLQPMVEKNGNRILVEMDRAPDLIRTDPTRLRQILSNLLANAAKFTRNGIVTLQVEASGPDQVAFLVTDTGIGMDPPQMERVFQEFVQANSTVSRKFGGTGLGLALVRRFVDLLGGQVSVDSSPDLGSTFRVILPRGGPNT